MKRPEQAGMDGASPLERALLEAGRSYRGSRSTRAKTLAALGLAGSAAAAGAAGAASLKVSLKLAWTHVLLGATVVGTIAAIPGGYYLWHRGHGTATATRPAAAATAHVPDGVVARPAAIPAAEPPRTPPAIADDRAPLAAPLVTRPGPRPAARTLPLAAELAAIDAARAALASGDAPRALARLDAYETAHPRGRLGLEAEVLRIDALFRSGRKDAARAHAESFLRRHPNSVLAAHARGYLAR